MNFNSLYYFQRIAQNESIRKASDELFISQSALSKSLRELETELECSLFDRNGRRLVLNENGRLLLQMANDILSQIDNIKPRLDEARRNNRTVVVDSFFEEIFDIVFSLNSERDIGTRVICRTTDRTGEQYVQDLLNGSLDIAFVALNMKEYHNVLQMCSEKGIHTLHVAQEQMYISAPMEEPYLNMKSCTFRDVEKMPMIKPGNNIWVIRQLEKMFAVRNKTPRYIHEMTTNYFLKQNWPQIHYPFATTLLYINHKQYHEGHSRRKRIPVNEPDAVWNLFLMSRQDAPREIADYVEQIKRELYSRLFTLEDSGV